MPNNISRENSDKVIFDLTISNCYDCNIFKASTVKLNEDKDELYRRREACANCMQPMKNSDGVKIKSGGEYKYDAIKKLEKKLSHRWDKGKSIGYDDRTVAQIFALKKEGKTQKEIAHVLGISEYAVSRAVNGKYSERTMQRINQALVSEPKKNNLKIKK